jgi:peptide/nickel transport system substrate-binding protein
MYNSYVDSCLKKKEDDVKRKLLPLVLAVLLIFTVQLVFGAGQTETVAKKPAEQVLVAALDNGPGGNEGDTARPYSVGAGHTLMATIYTPLTIFDANQENIIPHAAKSWSSNADFTVWTFVLHDKLTWNDGKPVTAHDMKFTVEFTTDPGYAAQNYENRNNAFQELVGFNDKITGKISSLDSVKVIDDKTIQFTLATPNPRYFANQYRSYILPAHAIDFKPSENMTTNWYHDPTRQVGSGAFTVSGFRPDEYLELSKNPYYFLGEPKLDKVIVRWFGMDITAATIALAAGEIDFSYVEYGSIATLGKGFDVYSGLMGVARFIHLNYHALPEYWKDVRVRQAIYYAIDRQAIAEGVFQGTHEVIPSAVIQKSAWEDHNWYEYNPEKAVQLLAEAGLKPQDIKFDIMHWQSDSMTIGAMDAVQYYLTEIGIDCTHYQVDLLTWRSRFTLEGSLNNEWAAGYRGASGLPYATDQAFLFGNTGGQGGNFIGMDLDKDFAPFVAKVRQAATAEQFNDALHAMSLKQNQLIPHIYLFVGNGYGVANERVKDFHWYPGTGGGPFLHSPERWYIED